MLDEATSDSARPESLDRLADLVSVASDFGVVWIAVSIAQVLLGRASAATAVRRLVAAGVTSLALTRVLKHHFAIPREPSPTASTLARAPSSSGFPSGHTLAAFTSALVIPSGGRARTAAIGFASLVAWARVRVGHHRPADVVAGAAVGSLAGAGLVIAGTRWRQSA